MLPIFDPQTERKKMRIHLTKTVVERLKPSADGSRIDYLDDKLTGFGVRVSTARKTYFVTRRVGGHLVRVKIDTYDKVTTEIARQQAQRILADMGQGRNPNKERQKRGKRALLFKRPLMNISKKGL